MGNGSENGVAVSQQGEAPSFGLQEYQCPEMEVQIAKNIYPIHRARQFLQLSLNQKIAYAKRRSPRSLYDDYSMTMCLIFTQPDFLQIEEEWVEMLLKAGMHIINEGG